MLKEVYEEPKVVGATLNQNLKTVRRIVDDMQPRDYDLFYITGSGTSYHAGLECQYLFFNFGMPATSLIPASEFSLWIPSVINRKALLIAISQSGESTDVLTAANTALNRGMDVLAVTNTEKSPLTQVSKYTLLTRAGEEVAVTATKSYVAQLAVLSLLSLELAERQKTSSDSLTYLRKKLFETPQLIDEVIKASDGLILRLAESLEDKNFFFTLGSGPNYATALETALKLKEACNIFAEGFAAREFLHGPIQLAKKETPVICILPSDEIRAFLSLLSSIRRFGAPVISLSDGENGLSAVSTETIFIPKGFPKVFSPIPYIIPLQLFAYYSSVIRGLNPDKPEKLSKVVK